MKKHVQIAPSIMRKHEENMGLAGELSSICFNPVKVVFKVGEVGLDSVEVGKNQVIDGFGLQTGTDQ